MKKIAFSILLLTIGLNVLAEVNILLLPQSGMEFKSSAIWRMTVSSNLSKPVNVRFEGTIRKEGKRIAVLSSQVTTLTSGVNSFNEISLGTQEIQYFNQDIARFEQTTGSLPQGNYQYCVKLVCADVDCLKLFKNEPKGQDCSNAEVIPVTPLLLAMPIDKSEIENTRPDFTWIPPMPIGNDPSINYKIRLVKLDEKQSAQSGIRRNRPLYEQLGISGNSLAFPPELEDLEIGSRYAWKVDAFLGKTFLVSSDVWEFKIKEKKEIIPGMPYVRLRTFDPSVYNAVNYLKFIYFELEKSGSLSTTLTNSKGEEIQTNLFLKSTSQGENKFKIDLRNSGLQSGEVYTVKFRQANGQLQELKFRYIYQQTVKK